jgi:hypothetical protein
LRLFAHLLLSGTAFWAGAAYGQTPLPEEEGSPDVSSTPAESVIEGKSGTAPQVYTPDYFEKFNPNTARDMVARLPGFTLQGGEGSERGFGQASLNILINDRRPSSKSSDASEILRRIPADTVTRIEIVDGASLDIPGLSGQVANIIATSGTLSGSWRYSARFEEGTEPQLLEGSLNLSGKKGQLEYVLGLSLEQFTFTENGPEQYFNGSGTLIEDRIEDGAFQNQEPELDLNLTYNRLNGDVANLNLAGSLQNLNSGLNEFFEAVTPEGTSGQSRSNTGEDEYKYEIGGDYSTDLSLFGTDGRLKLIGLHNLDNSDISSVFEFQRFGAPLNTTRFLREDVTTEYIARGEYTWKTGEKRDWTVSLEGAFNKLDSETALLINDRPAIPDDVQVEEKRIQANVTQSWGVSEDLNLQASLGAEYSEIHVVSEAPPARTFFRPKGFLSASYTASPRYTWRAKIERTVGQLNFNTFVSTVNLSENTENEGNDNIVPDQRWRAELALERKDDKGLSGTLRGFIDFVEDPIDRIIISRAGDGTVLDGPGNLDSALVYGANANLTWLLDDFGLKGMRLEGFGSVTDSEIEDPLTNADRAINSTVLWLYSLELRQDVPNSPYAWEAAIEQGRQSPVFRFSDIFDTRFIRPESRLSLIHKDLFGMQWTLDLTNIFDFKAQQERLIFSPNRNGDVIQRRFFSRQRGQRISISVTDTF